MSLSHRIRSGLAHALALVMLALTLCGPAGAAEKVGGSLEFVPADASLYAASMRLREQFDIARRSKAWRRFLEIPAVAMGWQMLQPQLSGPGSPLEPYRQLIELPENQQLVELLSDMVSGEIFVYGDPSLARFAAAVAEAYGDYQATSMIQTVQEAIGQAQLQPPPGPIAQRQAAKNREAARAFLKSLAGRLDDLTIPNLVFGFQLSQDEPALTQLKRLEVLAKMVLRQVPSLKDRLTRVTIDQSEYLTLSLDGGLVPWQEIRWQDFEDEPDEFAPLAEKLKSLTLNLTLGVRGKYLLVSLGSSNDHLARLGKGEMLVDRPELKPLAAFAGRRLTGVGFYGRELRLPWAPARRTSIRSATPRPSWSANSTSPSPCRIAFSWM